MAMNKLQRILSLFLLVIAVFTISIAEIKAAPEASSTQTTNTMQSITVLEKIRFSYGVDKTRIVCDLSSATEYNVVLQENPPQLIIDLQNAEIRGVPPIITLTDTLATRVITVPGQDRHVKVFIDLANIPKYNVFRLSDPNRIVIDLLKISAQKTEQQLDEGLRYVNMRKSTTEGFLAVHVLDFDLSSKALKPAHVLAKDEIAGLETVSAMASRTNAIAAVNGTFFTKTGELLGLVIHDDEIIQSPLPNRTAFALRNSGEIMISQVNYSGELAGPNGETCDINSINRERGNDEAVIYTPAYGKTTRTNEFGKEYTLVDGKVTAIGYGNSVIPPNGVVLSSHGECMKSLTQIKVGDVLAIRHHLDPDWTDVRLAVGAGPQLLKDGNVFLTTKSEGFGGDVGGGRAPRTALGVTTNKHLLLVVVDGRQPGYSNGVTLIELAKLMQDLGAEDAMNLDGGGSAELVIRGQVVNKPSDGRERLIGDALVFVPVQQKPAVNITAIPGVQQPESTVPEWLKRSA